MTIGWVDDQDRTHCTTCKATFDFFNRKHHCRACGRVFCSKCTVKRVSLPQRGEKSPVRVCDYCFEHESKRQTWEDCVMAMHRGQEFSVSGMFGSSRKKVTLSSNRESLLCTDPGKEPSGKGTAVADITQVLTGRDASQRAGVSDVRKDGTMIYIATGRSGLALQADNMKSRDQWAGYLRTWLELKDMVAPTDLNMQEMEAIERKKQILEGTSEKKARNQKREALRSKYGLK